MGYLSQGISRIGGRRVILAIGGAYVAFAAGFPVSSFVGDRAVGGILTVSILIGASGLSLLYAGYRLPRSSVRPDLYDVVASWCVRGISAMVGIVVFGTLLDSVDDPVSAFVVLPALASLAGLGMGYHDARARTRALDAEERQREAERYSRELERYQTIVETVNDGIFVLDEDSHFTLVNDAYTELVGYDREELIDSPASIVAAEETDVKSMSAEIQDDIVAGTTESKTYESTIQTASGETHDVESTVALLPEQEGGGQDKVVVVRDVTERNEREQRLEQQKRRLERQNERLESFAGMLAHELRNPVTIGQIYSQQLPAETDQEAVEYVTEAFDRIENIIDVMLVITRGQEAITESAPVELADVAREAWDEVDAPDATLEVTVEKTIRVDETYLRHLFRNLFENSVEHGSASSRPAADDAVLDGGGDVAVTVGDLPTGFYVADDGSGIPTNDQKTIFETGYTTASDSGGMGLGLTFVQEMADVYEWTCSVTESETGGARFEFENVTETHNVPE